MTFETLKSRIRGTLITAFDPGFATSCENLIWNGRKPSATARVIVRAKDALDVQEAVRFAAEYGMTVSARGGGHQFSGIAAHADMVIDLGALDKMRIDATSRTAMVEPAVTNVRLAKALEKKGLGFPVGHCGDVTVSGYLLGGGIGWNSNHWGVACFSVLSVDVVLADGQLVTATADHHPDIFWAARGAGPEFFGIVTSYKVRLYDEPKAATSLVRIYAPHIMADVADWAERAMERAPATVEFTVKIGGSPDGPVMAAIANIFASDKEEAEQIGKNLWSDAPEGALDIVGPMPTPISSLYGMTGESTPKGNRYGVDCVWSDGSFGEALAMMLRAMEMAPSMNSFALVGLRSNARPLPATAAFSQEGRVFSTIYGVWEDEAGDDANLAWLRSSIDRCRPFATGTYVGESDLDRPGLTLPRLSASAQARLAELTAFHDPAGLFSVKQIKRNLSAA